MPKHFWAKCLLAICELNERPSHPAAAKTYLTGCLQSHPDLAWLYLLRGFASAQLGDDATVASEATEHFQAAEADYRQVLERDHEQRYRYALLVNRGLMHFQRGKMSLAVSDLKEAIAINPGQINAHVTLAQVDRREHRLDLAIQRLGEAISLEPDLPALYRKRAQWSLERPAATAATRAAALADLREAIKRESPRSDLLAKDYVDVAFLLLEQKQFQEALEACEASLKIDADRPDAERYQVVALLSLRRYEDAKAACDRYLKSGSSLPALLELRGIAKSKLNDLAGAIDDYTRALAERPRGREAVLHSLRGWAYVASEAPQFAWRDFNEAIRHDPESAEAYGGRGFALAMQGRCREAVLDAEESLRHGDIDANLVYNAARTFAQLAQGASGELRPRGKLDLDAIRAYEVRAMKLLREAIEKTPREGRAAFWRNVIQTDPALGAIRRLTDYTRLAQSFGLPLR